MIEWAKKLSHATVPLRLHKFTFIQILQIFQAGLGNNKILKIQILIFVRFLFLLHFCKIQAYTAADYVILETLLNFEVRQLAQFQKHICSLYSGGFLCPYSFSWLIFALFVLNRCLKNLNKTVFIAVECH
jgi:hypothetical protein